MAPNDLVAVISDRLWRTRYNGDPSLIGRSLSLNDTPYTIRSATTGVTLSPYQENAWGISEGKRLFTQFNCVGCHANGGGGIGPPLMDDEWIYGHRADQIFRAILEGRPNGMPSFAGRIPDYQIWEIAAYVRSMGGLVSRYFLEVLEGWRDARALLTFGTPYRGSLNALDALASHRPPYGRSTLAVVPFVPPSTS